MARSTITRARSWRAPRRSCSGRCMNRQRKMTLGVFQAWVAYVLAGLVFYGTLDDNPRPQLARPTPELQWPVYESTTQDDAGSISSVGRLRAGGPRFLWHARR